MTSKALVVLSGGQDSTVCLFWAKSRYDVVHAVTFDYHQRHRVELEAAHVVANMAKVDSHEIISLGPILKGKSPLTNPHSELEAYKDYDSMSKVIGDRVELTFVPMRNALFLVLAANRAACLGIDQIVTGVCQADGANYPDCRMVFIASMTSTINAALDQALMICAPLLDIKKAESVVMALGIPGCYTALGYSHTAYDGMFPPTGKDHASVLRAHGFEEAGVPDPLVVRAVLLGLMDPPDDVSYHNSLIRRLPLHPGQSGRDQRDESVLDTLRALEKDLRGRMGIA